MTAGALLQLTQGTNDRMAFLTFNAYVTNFKTIYHKYVNFAMETISILPSRTLLLQHNTETQLSFKITRDGDLVKDMFLTFEFPDIYSYNGDRYHSFQWIQRLAEYLVKEIAVSLDTQQLVDRHHSEWLHIASY
jgi:hypothetical protein